MTFLMPHEIGTQQRPHQITFYLTNRLREFQATNELQQQVLTMAALRQERWIGKARIRQTPNKRREDHHRRNIPDLVMTAHIQDGDNPHILATLYTLDQQIELAFTEPLTMAQQKHYEGAAVWGRVVKRSRPADDFHDWLKYA